MEMMKGTWAGGMRFVYESTTGHGLVTDAPKQAGGLDTAVTPMELVLLGLIGCTGIDVSSILLKMKEPLAGLEVTAEYERADTHPKVYTRIHLKYTVTGSVDAKKLERAIDLSTSSYCSVSAMLAKAVEISNEYEILPEK
jgi:putative redox protein